MKKTTSAGGVVLNPDGHVLVVSQHGTSWSLPKGIIEPGEDEETAALREIEEESGLRNVRIIRKLGEYERFRMNKDGGDDRSGQKHIHIYLCRTEETDLKPIDPENPEARWVKPDDVADLLTHPKDREFYLSVLDEIRA